MTGPAMPSLKKRKKPTSRQNAYIGKAGQLAVMAELALLGYNVALPEIDKGDDIFVVNDNTGELWRLQVKGATPQSREGQYQVIIDERQITTKPAGNPDLCFVFALRRREEKRWRFVIMPRERLKKYIDDRAASGKYEGKFGMLKKERRKDRRTLSITFSSRKKTSGQVFCSYEPWETHMETWDAWPYLDHEVLAAAKSVDEKHAAAGAAQRVSSSY
jgi:hypothetical protein